MTVIEEALARSLGTDADRPAWLAARRGVCTATEAKTVGGAGSKAARRREIARLVDEKVSGEEAFRGNHFTEWGKMREPVILATLRLQMGFEVAGHLIAAAENPRHAATPDAWRVEEWSGALEIAEIKTSKNDIAPGSGSTFQGYLRQMWWQMYCTGATRCLYVWEPHDGDWSGWDLSDSSTWRVSTGPKPLPLGTHWVERDAAAEAGIAEMIVAADEMLAALDAKTAEIEAADPEEEPVDETALDEALADYLEEKRRGETALALARKRLLDLMVAAGKETHKVDGIGSVSVADPEPPKPTFNAKKFAEAEPEHYARFTYLPEPVPVLDVEKFATEEPTEYAKWLEQGKTKTDKEMRVTPARAKKGSKE